MGGGWLIRWSEGGFICTAHLQFLQDDLPLLLDNTDQQVNKCLFTVECGHTSLMMSGHSDHQFLERYRVDVVDHKHSQVTRHKPYRKYGFQGHDRPRKNSGRGFKTLLQVFEQSVECSEESASH